MTTLLVVLALVAAAIASLSLSQATVGVGIMAFACLLGILARVAQASQQHKESLARLPKLQ